MPRQETVLRVLVASPSDLAEERAYLEEIVRELNLIWSRDLGIRLDLVRWETHAVPGFSSDAQEVINQAIGDDYDIFIGLMWKRYGTPTGRAGSGTVEEFERAYRRYVEDSSQIRIMFYFKDTPVSPSELDPVQLAKIIEFRAQLRSLGGVDWGFISRDEFGSLLRVHLSSQIQHWKKALETENATPGPAHAPPKPAVAPDMLPQDGDESEYGLIELMEISEEGIERLTEALLRMGAEIEHLGSQVEERTSEFAPVRSLTGEIDRSLIKRVSKRTAGDLLFFAKRIEAELPVYSEALRAAFDALARMGTLFVDFGPEHIEGLKQDLDRIRQLRLRAAEAEKNLLGLRTAIGGVPRITGDLGRAKRRSTEVLSALTSEINTTQNLAEELEKSIRRTLDRLSHGPE
ncbi:hypothetical protein BH23GEM5_BH23GEM5_13260 [soil metagenome]